MSAALNMKQCSTLFFKGGGGGGGSVRIEPSQQLLDDCTHKRNSKKKVGKHIYHRNSLFISFPKINILKT